jgi:hypothetical protein
VLRPSWCQALAVQQLVQMVRAQVVRAQVVQQLH